MRNFIKINELSNGNIVAYKDRRYRVVWIQSSKVGLKALDGGAVENVNVSDLVSVDVDPKLLDEYLRKMQYKRTEKGSYECPLFDRRDLKCEIIPSGSGAFVVFKDDFCAIDGTALFFR